MNKLKQAYLQLAVERDRTRRQAERYAHESQRWTERLTLAKRCGEPELATQARERALQTAQAEIQLRRELVRQEVLIDQLIASLKA